MNRQQRQPQGTDYNIQADQTSIESLAAAIRRQDPNMSQMQAHIKAVRMYGQVEE